MREQRYFDDVPPEDLPILLLRAVPEQMIRISARIYNAYKNDLAFEEIAGKMWLEADELHDMLAKAEKLMAIAAESKAVHLWRLSELAKGRLPDTPDGLY